MTPDLAAVRPSSRTFTSLDLDTALDGVDTVLEQAIGGSVPGLTGPGPLCGVHQVLYRSPPLDEAIRIAGNFAVDLTLSSTLPGGNLVATLYRVKGSGTCVELLAGAADVGRVPLDLRHWATPGASRPFPVNRRTRVRARSLPLAAVVRPGDRLVLAIGGGSVELLPDPLKPRITIATPSSLSLPVAAGSLRMRAVRRRG